jgi:hypothetical protein
MKTLDVMSITNTDPIFKEASMSGASAARKQGEIAGLRPPEVIELESAIWDVKEWQAEHKRSTERGKELKENLAGKFRKCQLVAHAFNRQGEELSASLSTEDKVKVKAGKAKRKKRHAAFPKR